MVRISFANTLLNDNEVLVSVQPPILSRFFSSIVPPNAQVSSIHEVPGIKIEALDCCNCL